VSAAPIAAALSQRMLLLFLACATKGADTGADTDTTAETEATDATTDGSRASTAWFLGTGDLSYTDSGAEALTYEVLYQRRLEPGAARIVEDTYMSVDGALTHLHVELLVDGDTFAGSYSDDSGDLTVAGSLTGDLWSWFLWDSVATYTSGDLSGATLESRHEVHSRGLTAEKTLLDGGGATLTVALEAADPVDEESFNARLLELGG